MVGRAVQDVVLLDERGRSVGTAPKDRVHGTDTPLHLAFSCYVFNPAGELLVTRRSLDKTTWPGVWTNTCCGHPAPGEPLPDAVGRRLSEELGIAVERLELVLPTFRYRAEMADGTVENELCPVYRAVADGAAPVPDPAEVDDVSWVRWPEFASGVAAGQRSVSPWCTLQVPLLTELGPDPLRWPAAADDALPPAARECLRA